MNDALRAIADDHFRQRHLRSLVVKLLIGGEDVMSMVVGESMTGVPATLDGHFRNGAVAIAYVAALTLRLAEEGIVSLDEPIAHWMPELPLAEVATLRHLATMTAGYPDYVVNAAFLAELAENPFRHFSAEDRIAISLGMPRLFAPGENWDYSHSCYVILGRVLERATGQPMQALMDGYVLKPLGLTGTFGIGNAHVPEPVVHAYSAERGIYEDSTFWDPSWTITEGAVQVTTINDMARSFDAIVGTDGFLQPGSRQAMIAKDMLGFGRPLAGCARCRTLDPSYGYGIGVFLQGDWVLQTPSFGGYCSTVATLPQGRASGARVTVAVAATVWPEAYADWTVRKPNWAEELAKAIAALVVPHNPPPVFQPYLIR